MSSNPIPFPAHAARPALPQRGSSLNPWKRRPSRQPVGVRLFDFPASNPAQLTKATMTSNRPYLVNSEATASELSRLRPRLPVDGLAQARRIAQQVEREVAAKAARQPPGAAPGGVIHTLPVSIPSERGGQSARFAPRRLIQGLLSRTRTA